MVNRRNGHRRLFAPKESGRLEKVNVSAVGHQISAPFEPVTVAHLDTYAVHVTRCVGDGPAWLPAPQDSMVLCQEGRLTLALGAGAPPHDPPDEQYTLEASDLLVVPKGFGSQISSPTGALVLGVKRHKQPGLPLTDKP
jgi:hypothetical protein